MSQQLPIDTSVPTRAALQLKHSSEKRLLGYAALAATSGVGVLALVQPSEAEVVYTPTHVSFVHNTSTAIDINGDGITDFTVKIRTAPPGIGPTFSTRTSAAMLLYRAVKPGRIWGTNAAASALPAGVTVGPKGKFNPNDSFMGAVSAINSGAPNYGGPWAPPGGSEQNRYVGVRFVINGAVHFGWIRFSVQIRPARKGSVTALMTGYAYETVPNKPIITGKTHGADVSQKLPEKPGASLGQLALGTATFAAKAAE
jgi:hypothetical protein